MLESSREFSVVQSISGAALYWQDAATLKVLIGKDTDRMVGLHLLGAVSEEIVNLFSLAMREGPKTEALRRMIHAYPTFSSNLPYLL